MLEHVISEYRTIVGLIAMRVFDYFTAEDCPVIVDRPEGAAWEWSRGQWRDASSSIDKIYAEGVQLEREAFVEAYPHAALELLDAASAPSQEISPLAS